LLSFPTRRSSDLESAARTRLTGVQADVMPAENLARQNLMGAQATAANAGAYLAGTQADDIINWSSPTNSPLGSVLGRGGYQGFRLGSAVAPSGSERRLPGESEVTWLDRINGL